MEIPHSSRDGGRSAQIRKIGIFNHLVEVFRHSTPPTRVMPVDAARRSRLNRGMSDPLDAVFSAILFPLYAHAKIAVAAALLTDRLRTM